MTLNYLSPVVRTGVLLFILAPLFALEAQAQEDESEGASQSGSVLEEIVVTAQKREQSLQDVPISVSAVTGEDLAVRSENEISELTKLVPGFTFAEGVSDAGRNIQVRGVGTQTFSRGVDQSVGTVVDGVVASSIAASLLDFSDVSRVEVLRGPQGMLFGKNASAGILNIITNNPTAEFEWGAGFSFAEENERKFNGHISGPLMGETMTGRLSFYSNKRDGIMENIFPGGEDYNDRDEWGVRGKLLIEPNDDLSVLLSVTHSERDNQCCIAAAASLFPGLLADSLGVPAGEENSQVNENDRSRNQTDLDVYSAEINYFRGEYTLTSITSFTETDFLDDFRATNVPITFLPDNTGDAVTKQFTQEFRITSPLNNTVDYVAGLYYYRKTDERDYVRLVDLSAAGLVPFPGFVLSVVSHSDAELESLAAFGQMTWHVSEQARISVGARVNRDEVSILQEVSSVPGTIPSDIPGIRDADDTDTAFSWRIIGEYDITDDAMIYASVARGYKGPGVNTLEGSVDRPALVDAEIPTNYEIGLKSEWWNNRLRLNASLFHTSFEDFQTSVAEDGGPGRVIAYLDNAGELETQGFELEVDTQLSEQFGLSLALAYVDAEYTDYDGAPCYFGQSPAEGCIAAAQDLSGKRTANTPEWSYTVSSLYTLPLDGLPFDGFVNASYYWQDEVQYDSTNAPDTIGDSYGIADLSIGIAAKDNSYRIQLFAKNLLDEFYVTNLSRNGLVFGVPIQHNLAYTYQRRVGISAQFDFY